MFAAMHACSSPLECLQNTTTSCACANGQTGFMVCNAAGKIAYQSCPCIGYNAGVANADGALIQMLDATMGPTGNMLRDNTSAAFVDAEVADVSKATDAQRNDTGPIGPRCGDGQCDAAENCESCSPDCGACACQSCNSATRCANGFYCAFRACDGLPACRSVGSNAPSCAEISGRLCPAVSIYHACKTSQECGPDSDCMPTLISGLMLCSKRCGTNEDCPGPIAGGAVALCGSIPGSIGGHCFLFCGAAGVTCPASLVCHVTAPGMGFCG
jgi:hypothetical protein